MWIWHQDKKVEIGRLVVLPAKYIDILEMKKEIELDIEKMGFYIIFDGSDFLRTGKIWKKFYSFHEWLDWVEDD